MIPYNKQYIDRDDINNVIKVLKSPLITQGNQVPKLEKKIAKRCNAKFAVAVNSATSALHIACLATDLKKDDILWTVPNTFVASANCGLYCGAKVDFVDIDNKTYNIDINKLEKKLKEAKKKNCLPKILVPVHFAGQPTKQDRIWKLSKLYNFTVIEDASHSFGASYKSIKVGSCKWSHMTIFSFHPVKMITTGEGGMVLTNNKKTANRIQMLRNSGITREKKLLKERNGGPWYYEQQMLGFNYRMTDIQAALGISQLNKLNKFIKKRNAIAKRYDFLLKDLPIQLPFIEKYTISSFHLYVIRLKNQSSRSYKSIFSKLRRSGIGVNLHYLPVHLQPYYRLLGFKEGDFPISENYSSEALSLPMYYGLSESDQKKVVKQLTKIILK